MTELSHVGMTQCFFCGEDSQILLDRQLKNRVPRKCGVIDTEPCSKCQEHMKQGVILISVKDDAEFEKVEAERQAWLETDRKTPFIPNPYRMGNFAVVKEDWFRRSLPEGEVRDRILKLRWAFVPMDTWKQLGLPV